MAKHVTHTKTEGNAAVALCTCGWSSTWPVQDGSAEQHAWEHMKAANTHPDLPAATPHRVWRWVCSYCSWENIADSEPHGTAECDNCCSTVALRVGRP